ncbi:MAG: PepSY-associated TM helix domain-containing protein [Bacteroidota bacterium]
MRSETAKISNSTRFYRKIHKWIALPLFAFMMLVGITGLLLGWKKQTQLLPKTQSSKELAARQFIKLDSLQNIAKQYAKDVLKLSDEIDRIDIRPQKGIAKIVFTSHFTELQIDLKSGKILAVNTRKSDFIEKIHDGSIVDYFIKKDNDAFKLTYTTFTSLGLILLSFSGFWLWYNPIRIRKRKG